MFQAIHLIFIKSLIAERDITKLIIVAWLLLNSSFIGLLFRFFCRYKQKINIENENHLNKNELNIL
jgi:hypothetical protein